jgi:hypothetical protein
MTFGVTALVILGLLPAQQPALSSPHRVLIQTKTDRQAERLLTVGGEELEAVASSMGFVVVEGRSTTQIVETELWNPPRLLHAIEFVNELAHRDLAPPITISDLPKPHQKMILDRLDRSVRSKGGQKYYSLASPCEVSFRINIPYTTEAGTRTITVGEAISGNPSSPPVRRDEADLPPLASSPKKSRIHYTLNSALRDKEYFDALREATEALFDRREQLMRRYEDAEAELNRRLFPRLGSLSWKTPVSFDQLPPTLQAELTARTKRSTLSLASLRQAKFMPPDRSLVISFRIGESGQLSFGPRALFDD